MVIQAVVLSKQETSAGVSKCETETDWARQSVFQRVTGKVRTDAWQPVMYGRTKKGNGRRASVVKTTGYGLLAVPMGYRLIMFVVVSRSGGGRDRNESATFQPSPFPSPEAKRRANGGAASSTEVCATTSPRPYMHVCARSCTAEISPYDRPLPPCACGVEVKPRTG